MRSPRTCRSCMRRRSTCTPVMSPAPTAPTAPCRSSGRPRTGPCSPPPSGSRSTRGTAPTAVNRTGWTAVRPTIYCSVSDLPALGDAGWKGDVWVAWYNGNPAFDFTPPPGINVVAKQYTDTGGGGAYDLSTVFDPHWPQEAPMVFGTHEPTSANPGKYALTYVDSNGQAQEQTGWVECVHCKGLYWLNQQAASKCVGNPA